MRLRFILLLPLVLIIYACATQARPLKPVRPTPLPTELFSLVDPEPLQVTFAQIEANPSAYLNQLLRVQGSYVKIERPSCSPFQGPRLRWGLVADNLQMGAQGYDRIVELVPDGVPFTVDGIWRQYVGPAGCGKEPSSQRVYYLDVVDIVQPNPIMRVYGDAVADVTPVPTLEPPLPLDEEPDEAQNLPTPTLDSIVDIATLPPEGGGGGYPAEIPTLTPSPTRRVLPTNTSPRVQATNPPPVRPTNTSPPSNVRPTATPSTIDTSTPSPAPTATDVIVVATVTATAEATDDASETPTATTVTATVPPNATSTLPPTPTLFVRGTATPTPDVTQTTLTPTPTTSGTPATETPTPTPLTGTPPTATPTVTGTLTATPEETAAPTPDDGGLATATTDPNATPTGVPTRDGTAYPYP